MAVNKVIFNDKTLIDLTGDTATEEDVIQGKFFHRWDGERVEGTRDPNAGGGGSGGSTATEKGVNFYDYDGTLLHSYTVAEAQALTELPPLPEQEGLICQGWNWTLDDIKAHNRAVDVGATYITDDGKTRLYIRIAAEGRMSVPLYFSQTVANGVTIDWGDGSAAETSSGTGNVNKVHTYARIGEYVISLDVVDGCTLGLGKNQASYCVLGSTGNNGKVYCNMLQKVEVGNGVTSIGNYAFAYCYSLASIIIPDSVTSIGDSALHFCYSLASIIIPDSVTSIGGAAFRYCYSLTSITIPDGITNIYGYTFQYCYSLASIIIPDSVTSISYYAFHECRSLTSIIIPDGITSIDDYAFEYCYSLASIQIPDSVTSIGIFAFHDCRSLASIIIPDSVTSIDDYAFQGCDSLTSIIIPDGITSINVYAFYKCCSLASIIIPDSVTSIYNSAFYQCYGMKFYDFTSHTAVPTLSDSKVFQNIPSDCEIRVPAALYDEWIAATNWSSSSIKSKIVAV